MARPVREGGSGNYTFLGGRPTPTATAILVALVATFIFHRALLSEALAQWVTLHFALVPSQALGRQPWQLVTSTFISPGLAAFVLDLLGVLFVASVVEQRVGRWRTLALFFGAQLAGAIAAAAVGRAFHQDTAMGGASQGALALVVAFGVLYGQMPVRLWFVAEMRGRTLALIVIAIGLVSGTINALTTGDFRSLAAFIAAAATGWALVSGGVARMEMAYQKWRLKRLRRRYRVIPGGRDGRRYLN